MNDLDGIFEENNDEHHQLCTELAKLRREIFTTTGIERQIAVVSYRISEIKMLQHQMTNRQVSFDELASSSSYYNAARVLWECRSVLNLFIHGSTCKKYNLATYDVALLQTRISEDLKVIVDLIHRMIGTTRAADIKVIRNWYYKFTMALELLGKVCIINQESTIGLYKDPNVVVDEKIWEKCTRLPSVSYVYLKDPADLFALKRSTIYRDNEVQTSGRKQSELSGTPM